jgi:hypothetical protein
MKLFFAIALLGLTASAATLQFAIVSDTHIGDSSHYVEPGEPARNFEFIQTNFSPAFVLACGDITQSATADEYSAASNIFATNLTCNYYLTPGNHDETVGSGGQVRWGQYLGVTNVAWTNGNWKFVSVYSQLKWANQFTNFEGQISTNNLNWLASELTNAANYNKLVFTHFSAVADSQWPIAPGYGLEDFTNMLTTNGVALLLHGNNHYISNETSIINGVTRQIAMPSLAYSSYSSGSYGGSRGQFELCTFSNTVMTLDMYDSSISNNYPLHLTSTFTIPAYSESNTRMTLTTANVGTFTIRP